MNYQRDIASIGNDRARLNELLRLVELHPERACSLLFGALWDVYPPNRNRAAAELAARMTPKLSVLLARLLQGDDVSELADRLLNVTVGEVVAEVRRAACLALRAQDVSEEAVAALSAAVSDRDAVVRYHALLALFENADEATLREATRRALGDDDHAVLVVAGQLAAELDLRNLRPRIYQIRDRLQGRDRFQNAVVLAKLSEGPLEDDVLDDLLEGLKDEHTLGAAARALGELDVPEAVEPLNKVLKSWFAHPLLRVEAAAALARMGREEGAEYLGKMLSGRRKDTRGYAIELVARLGIEQFRPIVFDFARSDEYHTDTAVLVLAEFGDAEAHDVLEEIASHHANPEIRALARKALARDGSLD